MHITNPLTGEPYCLRPGDSAAPCEDCIAVSRSREEQFKPLVEKVIAQYSRGLITVADLHSEVEDIMLDVHLANTRMEVQ